jgi:hypothetical protein
MTNRFKWNVDEYSIGKPDLSGIGGVLRNHHGILLGIFSLSVGILNSNVVELRTVSGGATMEIKGAIAPLILLF